jgi:hypothetical protein
MDKSLTPTDARGQWAWSCFLRVVTDQAMDIMTALIRTGAILCLFGYFGCDLFVFGLHGYDMIISAIDNRGLFIETTE